MFLEKVGELVWCPECKDHRPVDGPWGDVECPECHLTGFWADDKLSEDDKYQYVEWDNL